jgi:hypothetical protein
MHLTNNSPQGVRCPEEPANHAARFFFRFFGFQVSGTGTSIANRNASSGVRSHFSGSRVAAPVMAFGFAIMGIYQSFSQIATSVIFSGNVNRKLIRFGFYIIKLNHIRNPNLIERPRNANENSVLQFRRICFGHRLRNHWRRTCHPIRLNPLHRSVKKSSLLVSPENKKHRKLGKVLGVGCFGEASNLKMPNIVRLNRLKWRSGL